MDLSKHSISKSTTATKTTTTMATDTGPVSENIHVSDHGLNVRLEESATGLQEYLKTVGHEAQLLAEQKHDQALAHHFEEKALSAKIARDRLHKEAARKEEETLYNLKRAEEAAKEMMEDAKVELKEQETGGKSQTFFTRITEKIAGKSHQVR